MNNSYREIKSALWQKLFIFPISLLICGSGVVTCLAPFVPVLHTNPQTGQVDALNTTEIIMAVVIGVFMSIFGFAVFWAVIKYSIRADTEGIRQTNGFFTQYVRWSDVAHYYREPNRRYHNERRLHVEPVMLNSESVIIFRGFAHILVSTRKIIEQRRELWQFVETQLEGKKIDAPSADLDPEVLASRSLEVNWSEKSTLWKVGRLLALACYGLFWLSVSLLPMYYIVTNNLTVPKPWGSFIALPMFLGPLLPHLIWLHFKKRKIAKELKMRDVAK